jgi:triosephosphate isomerase
MLNKQIYIIGNWKMNPPSLQKAQELFRAVLRGLRELGETSCGSGGELKIIICPPFPYLKPLIDILNTKYLGVPLSGTIPTLSVGAQDVFYEKQGAFTGEVSPEMLKDLGVKYVLIGHSERRRILGETDELINKKIKACLNVGLKPIFLIGDEKSLNYHGMLKSKDETSRELERISTQLKAGLKGVPVSALSDIIFGYEPIWAISNVSGGKNADVHYTTSIIQKIRFGILTELYDKKTALNAVFIYGGSSNAQNIKSFLESPEISGVLPGSASLSPKEFVEMVKISCF